MVRHICAKFGREMQNVILNEAVYEKLLSIKSYTANARHPEFKILPMTL